MRLCGADREARHPGLRERPPGRCASGPGPKKAQGPWARHGRQRLRGWKLGGGGCGKLRQTPLRESLARGRLPQTWVSHASELPGVATPGPEGGRERAGLGLRCTHLSLRVPRVPAPQTQPQPRPGLCRLHLFLLHPAGPLSSPEAGQRLRWSPEGRAPVPPLSIGVCLCSWPAASHSSWLAPSWGLRVLLAVCRGAPGGSVLSLPGVAACPAASLLTEDWRLPECAGGGRQPQAGRVCRSERLGHGLFWVGPKNRIPSASLPSVTACIVFGFYRVLSDARSVGPFA